MDSIKSFFRKKHKYQDEFPVHARDALRQNSFRQPVIKNPYSIVTEPKTKKGPRSCPGGRIDYSTRHNNSMYENLNNSNVYRQKMYAQQMLRQKPIAEVDEQRILIQNSFHHNVQHSSEYGSADPSPTNPYYRGNQSFDSTDSEAESSTIMYYKHLYEKKMRKMERKYRKAERMTKTVEENYYNLECAYQSLKNQSVEMQHMLNVYKVKNEMLQTRINELEKSQQQASMNEPVVYGGAPEAMCSISELNPETISSYPSRNPPSYHSSDNNDHDEVKTFENNEVFEIPRCASNSLVNPCHLSPDSKPMNQIVLDENVYLPMNAKHPNENLVHFKKDNDSSQSDEEEEEDQKTAINVVAPTTQILYTGEEHPIPLLQIKRSFSDSDLRDLRLVINEDANEMSSSAKQTSHNRLKRASTRYSKVDNSSSYSSDDDRIRDTIEVQKKQLKPRVNSQLVHYRPPRRTILNKGTNVYRRCGPNERKAIAEFDYLQDISTSSGHD